MPCRNHPEVETGLARCHGCGHAFCAACLVDVGGKPFCAPCKMQELAASAERGEGDTELPPWERRDELGMATAMWRTITHVNGDPSGFFRRMDTTRETWDCLAVPCVLGVLSTLTMSVAMLPFLGWIHAELMPQASGGDLGMTMFAQGFGLCGGIVFAPVSAIISVFITAGLIHVFLAMTNKVRVPFHQTMRGYCYSQGPLIVTVIPGLGHIVGALWSIWTAVVMVREVHRTSWGTAWMSVLWYMVLACVVCGGLYAALIAIAIAAQR